MASPCSQCTASAPGLARATSRLAPAGSTAVTSTPRSASMQANVPCHSRCRAPTAHRARRPSGRRRRDRCGQGRAGRRPAPGGDPRRWRRPPAHRAARATVMASDPPPRRPRSGRSRRAGPGSRTAPNRHRRTRSRRCARHELLATGETVRKRRDGTPAERSPRRRSTSPGWRAAGERTPRSAGSCTSAPGRSNGTCASSSPSSVQLPQGAPRCAPRPRPFRVFA